MALLLVEKPAATHVAAAGWPMLPYLVLNLQPCSCAKGSTARQSLTAEASATLALQLTAEAVATLALQRV